MKLSTEPIDIEPFVQFAKQNGLDICDGKSTSDDAEMDVISPPWNFPNNDQGNAMAFVARVRHLLRYVPQREEWLIWNGMRWRVDGTHTALNQLMDECERQWLRDAADISDEDARKKAAKRALSFGDKNSRLDALTMAQHQHEIVMESDTVDANPWLVGVENGILDLKTAQLVANGREHHITKSLAVAFDPSATCPKWERFIARVTRGHDGLASFLQRSVGYSLAGLTAEHVFWFLHGGGCNGKTTFIEILQWLSGEYGRRASDRLLAISKNGNVASEEELAGLPGIRFLLGSETTDGVKLNEQLVKGLCGGDTLRGRKLYKAGFDFRPVCKLWMFGNHRPEICGTDHGIWRRVRLVPFTATIGDDEKDPELPAKLLSELPGILNWALAGLRDWDLIGLAAPPCVTAATADYRDDQDTLADFIAECVERPSGIATPKAELYAKYELWARDNGQRHALSAKTLSRRLKDRGFIESPAKSWADCRLKFRLSDF